MILLTLRGLDIVFMAEVGAGEPIVAPAAAGDGLEA